MGLWDAFDPDDQAIVILLKDAVAELKTLNTHLAQLKPTTTVLDVNGHSAAVGPIPVLTLPMSPKVLNEMVNAADLKGVATMGVWKLKVAVPAGQTVTVVQPVVPGTVHVFMAPLGVTASYYSDAITATVEVDSHPITPPQTTYAINASDQIPLGQYYYMTQGMVGQITNATSTNTTITFAVEALAIQTNFFNNQFYRPLITFGMHALRTLADQQRGGGSA